MEIWLLLIIILSLITYFLVKRSVAKVTRTPIWLLWLVMMAPGLIWTGWLLLVGKNEPTPLLLFVPFLICPLLYLWLVQLGRPKIATKEGTEAVEANNSESPKTQKKEETVRPITPGEEKALRDCFPWGVYYLQQLDYRPQAILCLGKLRAVPEVAYQTIRENIEGVFGDRFVILFQESLQGQPFFALVPNPWSKSQQTSQTEPLKRPGLALSLLLITLFTTTVIGVEMSGISPEQFQSNPNLFKEGLGYSLGILSILGVHELSHYFAAVYHKVKTTLPYFIPIPLFLGTFGAFIQMRSPVPNRKALFDIAIAGPIGGFVVTLPILIWGLSLSEVVPVMEKSSLLSFHALDPRFSFVFAVLGKLALGKELIPGMAINLHPLAIAGYIGLVVVTPLNLMPVGQLDGGHIVHAMFGQRTAIIIGQVARLLMFVLALIQPDFLLWAILLLFIPIVDQPTLNDVTELDNWRDFWGLLVLVLLVSILLPLPGTVAQWLNI